NRPETAAVEWAWIDVCALLHQIRPCLRALTVLRAGAAGHADRSDNFPLHQNRQTTLDWHGALKSQQSKTLSTRRKDVLQRLRRPLEPRRRACLVLSDVDTGGLRAVELLEVHEVA